jgi:hypothetical protein
LIVIPAVAVALGRYLCEVRARQYWRFENLKSFDEFLERRFPGSRRKAYYLMSIHEHLPPQVRKELKQMGWTKGRELAKLMRAQGQHFDLKTSDKPFSHPSMGRCSEPHYYQTGANPARRGKLPGTSQAGTPTRWLALPAMRFHDKSRSAPPTISQPLR